MPDTDKSALDLLRDAVSAADRLLPKLLERREQLVKEMTLVNTQVNSLSALKQAYQAQLESTAAVTTVVSSASVHGSVTTSPSFTTPSIVEPSGSGGGNFSITGEGSGVAIEPSGEGALFRYGQVALSPNETFVSASTGTVGTTVSSVTPAPRGLIYEHMRELLSQSRGKRFRETELKEALYSKYRIMYSTSSIYRALRSGQSAGNYENVDGTWGWKQTEPTKQNEPAT